MASKSFDNGYALIIGIADYVHLKKLSPAILNDVADVSALLADAAFCGYPASQVRTLVDAAATAAGIRAGIDWLAAQTGDADTAILYFSGHGWRYEDGLLNENYLLPVNADLTDLPRTAINGQELTVRLRRIRAKRLLALFDCCHAGGLGEPKEGQPAGTPILKSGLDDHLYEQLIQGSGRAIIASSRADELSWVIPGMTNSLFTHWLLEGLRGEAPTSGDGLIRLFGLFDYVSKQVAAHHDEQHPILKAELEADFPIALFPEIRRPSTVPIKSDLLRRIRFRLRELAALESDQALYTLFQNNEELAPWINRLPEGASRQARADGIVAYLSNRCNKNSENALVLLLRVLAREYADEDRLQAELSTFADRLESLFPC